MTTPTDYRSAQWVSQLATLVLPIRGPAIIGITGAQGSGKSTLAAQLAKQHLCRALIVAFGSHW